MGELQRKWKFVALKRACLVVRKRPKEDPWSSANSAGACGTQKGWIYKSEGAYEGKI
jgi:hypothetical protein